MPDDGLDEWHTHALVDGGDATPIVDAQVIEPEPDCTDFLDSSNVGRASNAGRRTYSVRDFERLRRAKEILNPGAGAALH